MSEGKYAARPGSIPGTPLNLGGLRLVMAPLNFAQVEQFESLLPNLGRRETFAENVDEALPVIHASLSRNYPDLTLAELRLLLDLDNFPKACDALVRISGYTEAAPGESVPAGQ